MNKIFQVATFIPRKAWNYTKALNTATRNLREIFFFRSLSYKALWRYVGSAKELHLQLKH